MIDALTDAVRRFEAEFEIADEDAAVTAILLDLLRSRTIRGKQIHDANIVATMRRYGIHLLLTHNRADFMRYVPDISILSLDSSGE
jgi:predicted nucleic acid-binding protein